MYRYNTTTCTCMCSNMLICTCVKFHSQQGLTLNALSLSQAVQFLHECGVLLYYSDLKTKLSELYFLNPEWLCSLMAQIITIPEINPFISKDGVSVDWFLLLLYNVMLHCVFYWYRGAISIIFYANSVYNWAKSIDLTIIIIIKNQK